MNTKNTNLLERHFSEVSSLKLLYVTEKIKQNVVDIIKKLNSWHLNFNLFRVYNYARNVLFLLHHSSKKQWRIRAHCEPEFLLGALQDISLKVQNNPDMSDCSLLIDGMSFRKQILYDLINSKCSGFVDDRTILCTR